MGWRNVIAATLFAACVWYGFWGNPVRDYTPDDTYIFLRYGENAMHPGYRLGNFNPYVHEQVDGASSVPWMLVSGVLISNVDWVKAASMVCLLATIGVMLYFNSIISVLPVIIFGYSWVAGVSGMDTALAAFLYLLALKDETSNVFTVTLAMCVRPESVLVVPTLLAIKGGYNMRAVLITAAIIVALRVANYEGGVYSSAIAKLQNPGKYIDFWRYFFPVIPAILVMVDDMVASVRKRAVVLTVIAVFLGWSGRNAMVYAAQYAEGFKNAHVQVAQELSGVDTLAISDAGIVPFQTRAYTIDLVGINTPEIAHGEYPVTVVDRLKPEAVVLISQDRDEFVPLLYHEGPVHQYLEIEGYHRTSVHTFGLGYHLMTFRK